MEVVLRTFIFEESMVFNTIISVRWNTFVLLRGKSFHTCVQLEMYIVFSTLLNWL